VLVDGDREWTTWEDIDIDDSDFPECGAAFEESEAVETGTIGVGDAKLFSQRSLVDFGVEWFETNRTGDAGG
jgi:aminoglycoside 3-N-acetyltransferase